MTAYNRCYDSDSTGYGSSSDTSSPLTASQFILRPVTVLSSYSNHSLYEKVSTTMLGTVAIVWLDFQAETTGPGKLRRDCGIIAISLSDEEWGV
ncbi:unnamed protein product [Heligmosomoides polygyrus]|uniref:Uncharacterized protein n=1 Tax=Heligmosomoides polygyrus TaxID=6339 RepID=A0A183FM96_HELPZ|nr:unnamed protein product [Heligmosomoides polygyrus]